MRAVEGLEVSLPTTLQETDRPTLLILSCSQRKRLDVDMLPAIERYDGPTFRLLRRFLTNNKPESPQIAICILSAEFGLISDGHLIPYYDRRMTKQRASQLQPEVLTQFQIIINSIPARKLYICAGRNYLKVLEGYESVILPDTEVQIASGSLGKKLVTLYTWLYGKAPEVDRNLAQQPPGQICIKGVKLEMTPEQVLDIARQALAQSKGNPSTYQSWYAVVDGKKVSTKWLVSQLTGLPVSSFHSISARKILVRLGVEVLCL